MKKNNKIKRELAGKRLYVGLIISFCIIILFSIILTAVGAATISMARNDYTYTVSQPEAKIGLLKDVKTEFMLMRYRVANYVMNSGDADYINNVAKRQYDVAMATLFGGLDTYILLNKTDGQLDASEIENNIADAEIIKELIEKYAQYAEQVMQLSIDGDARAADDKLKKVIPLAESALELIDEMVLNASENIQFVSENMNTSSARSIRFLIILATILVVFASILSFIIVKAISKYISSLREAKFAAAEASRLKSVFLANMSHEIRTPMNGIIGFTDLAIDDELPPKTRDYLDKIKYSAEGLLQIINDILDTSKIEAGKMVLESIPFSLSGVYRICQAIIEPKAMEKGITLFCYAEPSINGKLIGDPTRLRQILLNLLSNAVKFTNVGIVKLLSGISNVTDNEITVLFEVKDSGIGLTPEQIENIMEPFAQADASTTRKYGGTGLGLSITKNMIELMGGKLVVESTPGVGSRFSFEITFKKVDEDGAAFTEPIVLDKFEKPSFDGEVLVCEDNSMNQHVIRDHLLRLGLTPAIANNGKEGVELVQERLSSGKKPFDLIFMDIHMPVMDGLEAAKKLEKIGNKTPVVALTANVMPNDREIYAKNGIPDCLSKPFATQDLWTCLLKYITPADIRVVNSTEASDSDEKLRNQLRSNFLKDNRTTFRDINAAIAAGDIKLAHRLAHTLRGVAGLIGEKALWEAANTVEGALKEGQIVGKQLDALGAELDAVLTSLSRTIVVPVAVPATSVDKEKIFAIIEKLEPLLKENDTDSFDMIEELAVIPGSGALIEQIERFNFASARDMLSEIKSKLEDE